MAENFYNGVFIEETAEVAARNNGDINLGDLSLGQVITIIAYDFNGARDYDNNEVFIELYIKLRSP